MYINENPTKEELQEIEESLRANRYRGNWNAKTSISLANLIKNGTYVDMSKFKQTILKTLDLNQTDLSLEDLQRWQQAGSVENIKQLSPSNESYLEYLKLIKTLSSAENIYLNANDVFIMMKDFAEHYKGKYIPEGTASALFNEHTAYCISKQLLQYSFYNSTNQDNQITQEAFENFQSTLEKAYGPFMGKDYLPAHTAYLDQVIARHQQRESDPSYVMPE